MRLPRNRSVVSAGPVGQSRLCGLSRIALPRAAEARLVLRIEVVVDTDVVLIAIGIVAISVRRVLALHPAQPSNACGVQSIADRIVVGKRHPAEQIRNPSGRIQPWPVRISAEKTLRSEIIRCGCRPYRIAGTIHGGYVRKRVAVLYSGKETEVALARLFGKDKTIKVTLRYESL